jgi:hypothetical protein
MLSSFSNCQLNWGCACQKLACEHQSVLHRMDNSVRTNLENLGPMFCLSVFFCAPLSGQGRLHAHRWCLRGATGRPRCGRAALPTWRRQAPTTTACSSPGSCWKSPSRQGRPLIWAALLKVPPCDTLIGARTCLLLCKVSFLDSVTHHIILFMLTMEPFPGFCPQAAQIPHLARKIQGNAPYQTEP